MGETETLTICINLRWSKNIKKMDYTTRTCSDTLKLPHVNQGICKPVSEIVVRIFGLKHPPFGPGQRHFQAKHRYCFVTSFAIMAISIAFVGKRAKLLKVCTSLFSGCGQVHRAQNTGEEKAQNCIFVRYFTICCRHASANREAYCSLFLLGVRACGMLGRNCY
jgi:hypothetical protein